MNVSKNINWSPKDYAEAAVLARDAGTEMLNRLEVVTLKPQVIVDVGCGTGELSAALQLRYPDAQVIAIDTSEAMITYAQQQTAALTYLCADTSSLPSHSVDLVFANLLLPWQFDITKSLQEFRRILRTDGLLIFTAFGPDTLSEYREQPLDLPTLIDMHDVGDLLLQEGFVDPVLDVDYYTLEYKDKQKLLNELRATGMIGADTIINPIINAEKKFSVTYEVIFAHTFAPAPKEEYAASQEGIVKIPLADLKRKLRA